MTADALNAWAEDAAALETALDETCAASGDNRVRRSAATLRFFRIAYDTGAACGIRPQPTDLERQRRNAVGVGPMKRGRVESAELTDRDRLFKIWR